MAGRNARIKERRERLDLELEEGRVSEEVNRRLDELLEDPDRLEEDLATLEGEIDEETDELGEDLSEEEPSIGVG